MNDLLETLSTEDKRIIAADYVLEHVMQSESVRDTLRDIASFALGGPAIMVERHPDPAAPLTAQQIRDVFAVLDAFAAAIAIDGKPAPAAIQFAATKIAEVLGGAK